MTYLYNRPELKKWRQRLRRNQTDAEKRLWQRLRNRQLDGLKFFRQYSVGPYALDFYSPALRLAVELDGPYHDMLEQKIHDQERTAYLKSVGINVLRFRNEMVVENIEQVLQMIRKVIQENHI